MKKKQFTLIELLIVVAIIGILVSILMPALGSARKKAQRAVCLSNVSQISKAFIIYATNKNGNFPLIGEGVNNQAGLSAQLYFWKSEVADELRHNYLNGSLQIFDCPEWGEKQVTESTWDRGNPTLTDGLYRFTNYIAATTARLTPPLGKTRDVDGDGSADDLKVYSMDDDTNKMLVGDSVFESTPAVFEFGRGAPHMNGAKAAGGNFAYVDGSAKWTNFPALKPFFSYYGSVSDKTRVFYWWTRQ